MKFFIIFLFLLSSCGTMTITPRGCQTKGMWGSERNNEQFAALDFYMTGDDKEVLIRDLLALNHVKCYQVKSLRVKLITSYFVKRRVEIYYTTE